MRDLTKLADIFVTCASVCKKCGGELAYNMEKNTWECSKCGEKADIPGQLSPL